MTELAAFLGLTTLTLAVACAILSRRLRAARTPRKVLTRKDQPHGEFFINPVVLLGEGNNFAVMNNEGPDAPPRRLAFTGCEVSRWDLCIDSERATARLHCVIEGCEIWQAVEEGVR